MMNANNFLKSDLLIEGHSLLCHRGGRLVFTGLDFSVQAGMAMMVRGANGAGKTSLLRVIAGFLPLSGGSLKRPETASLYHYLGHQNALKKQKTVMENLSFWAGFHGTTAIQASYDDILAAAGIDGLADMKTAALSSGQQRRLALTRLIAAPRPIWLLDEPLTGLDDNGKDWLSSIAQAHLAQNGLIIAASHDVLPFTTHDLMIGGAKL
ncbi:hypothetical protein IMCC14465_10320 [alpha proteobacterium IMCC14465]|uniref:ABC transporter domain-containing protein n=1 Tax=alpha proteobacterium IMCC14465 TaxID=1220535 RepID=J9DH77_9PROT|nr:hypothetical protein IMCC14465_10320 [alpha proteobacterium IMCC14465]